MNKEDHLSSVDPQATPSTALKEPVDDVIQDYLDNLLVEGTEAQQSVAQQSAHADVETQQKPVSWKDQSSFECLIIELLGLKLAIPLCMLGGIHTSDGKVTPLFGQGKYSLGVWKSEERTIKVIDTAQFVMPEKQRSLAEEGYQYFIQLDRAPLALACQSIGTTIQISADDVRWSGESNKRPWLAGTVISEMCALIDVDGVLSSVDIR